MKGLLREESGTIMVEATIYYPIVIFAVFAMIYLGMVKYQDSLLAYQVEHFAVQGGREVAYQGYEELETEGETFPGAEAFEAYYDRHAEHLYNEWRFNYSQEESRIRGELEEALSRKSFLTGVETTAKVDISNYVIGKSIQVTATYGVESPRFLTHIGVPLELRLGTSVKQNASNPAELVRNIDLAGDLIDFLLERFGVKGKVDGFLKKVEDIKNKIL